MAANDISPIQRQQRLMPAQYDERMGQNQDPGDGWGLPEVELREYFRVVFKYRKLIGASALLFGMLSLIYAFTATPRYTAESKIRISSYEPVLQGGGVEDVLQQRSKESTFLDTQIEEIKSYSIADKVLDNETIVAALEEREKPGLLHFLANKQEVHDYNAAVERATGYDHSISTIKTYLDAISVKPIRRTSLVIIEASTESPGLSALIANKHAESYIDWVRESRIEQQARGLQFLRAQADELREKVADLERELADYAEANSIVAVNKDENITAQKMSQLNVLLTNATAKRIQLENEYKEAQKTATSSGNDDASTLQVRSELAKLQGEYSQLSEKFTPEYPRMKQLSSQIEQLEKSVQGSRGQTIEGLKSKADAAKKEEDNLKEELDQQKSQAFELSKKQVQYNILNRELTSSRDLLQNVLKQSKETSIAVESNSSNVSIVDYAVVPKSPSFPNKKLVLALGLLLGLGAGLGGAFLLHYLDNTIKTPEDVQRALGLPSLGIVPSFELEWRGVSSGGLGKGMAPPNGAGSSGSAPVVLDCR